jgi:hypothetical protein
MPILLSNGTSTTSRAVISDQSDFAFNPISNLLTVANISSTTGSVTPVTMTASYATSASIATIASGLPLSGSSSTSGQVWLGDFVTADHPSSNPALVRALNIRFGNEVYTIYAVMTS